MQAADRIFLPAFILGSCDMLRFIRSEEDDVGNTWEVRLAHKYYAKLFKEYAIVDLSRYKVSHSNSPASIYLAKVAASHSYRVQFYNWSVDILT